MAGDFFIREKIKGSHIVGMLLYTLNAIISMCLYRTGNNTKTSTHAMFLLCVGLYLALYLFLYKAFRNFYIVVWGATVGMIHFIFYLVIRNDFTMISHGHNTANVFISTIISQLLYQISRYISFQLQGQDLIAPAKFESAFDDGRRATTIDKNLFFGYVIVVSTILFLMR